MNAADKLKEKYESANQAGIPLVSMDALCLAGYYITNYPAAPVQVLLQDITKRYVSYSIGQSAKIILLAVTSVMVE